MSNLEIMLVAGVAIPLASFAFLALFGAKLGKPLAAWVATAAIAASCVLATIVLVQWWGMDAAARQAAQSPPFLWAHLGTVPLLVGVNLDSLTVIMFFMVSFIATWIHVFSMGYMAGHSDEVDGVSKYHRFFTYLSLFCFSMLGLVIANSLLFLFIFWELVGLCSYLLIGFYFHKKSASNAAMKAFITNRVGDFGFIIGLGMVLLYLGDFTLSGAAREFAEQHAQQSALFTSTFLGVTAATWMGVLLFCGAIGKSAQFPLHVWLPDAMEGPTPVSALIHAATMVAAGVYLVARIFVLLTPGAQMVVAVIGCITLTLGALIAIVQTDIKKVLAYSTISQLGYMILGMGVGAWIGALFHLLTHAFFKALMFLGSGQVIEGCHHEQDMRKMGGLWRKMPVTCVTFLVGVLAIAGAGIPLMHVGLGGYFSKDEILAVAYHRTFGGEHHDEAHGADATASPANGSDHAADHGHAAAASHETAGGEHHVPVVVGADLPKFLFILPLAVAYITPFYMMRAWWMTFMGKPRDHHVYDHAHESPLMYIPLVVLAVGTVFSSYLLFRPMVAQAAPAGFLVKSIDGNALHAAHHALAYLVGPAFVIGFAIAIAIYRKGLGLAESLAKALRPAHTVLEHKFYFDELYGLALIGGVHGLKKVAYLFDQYVIDFLVNLSARITERLSRFSGEAFDARVVDGAVNAVGEGTWQLGGLVRAPQVGRIRNYILFAACGVTAIVLLVVRM
ncbi:MAG TPA: NADH-quinone oxidoreductase subunit L [Phycisphaerae bacterium]|nr:NADH-quinone oxidoreductase subunit L [Phycisphaerae bacterium]HOJ73581.1 NADH-quinone oxidoreductase subunit L [Phycisphaerae bacterium]HOM51610.1 NADH-quinone oxidoreductase subunit L [Phycisphaerae bacterium]HON65061.1 NADH-quinone oxidoreductase subunit L [Phycisphaerae bacterium]HOQ85243.1 NADH-quinone oxidoreductase subunit L [Phycisphaerae bacterium]